MALFNRNKTKPVVLPEVERYYDAERRERSGLAWILALVSIAGVVIVLIGLFFGGRLIYRTLTDDNKPKTATVQNTTKNNEKKSSDNNAAKNDTNKGATTPSTTTPSTPKASTPAPTATAPATTAPSSTLSNTGPESVIPYFVIATVIGTLSYRRRLSKSN